MASATQLFACLVGIFRLFATPIGIRGTSLPVKYRGHAAKVIQTARSGRAHQRQSVVGGLHVIWQHFLKLTSLLDGRHGLRTKGIKVINVVKYYPHRYHPANIAYGIAEFFDVWNVVEQGVQSCAGVKFLLDGGHTMRGKNSL